MDNHFTSLLQFCLQSNGRRKTYTAFRNNCAAFLENSKAGPIKFEQVLHTVKHHGQFYQEPLFFHTNEPSLHPKSLPGLPWWSLIRTLYLYCKGHRLNHWLRKFQTPCDEAKKIPQKPALPKSPKYPEKRNCIPQETRHDLAQSSISTVRHLERGWFFISSVLCQDS